MRRFWSRPIGMRGKDEFIEEFDCVKGGGNSVNVWINNTKGNGDLVPIFYIDGDEVADSA